MTKRHLGLSFILVGSAVSVALFLADFVGASNFEGVGPIQRLVLAAAVLLVLVGISLLPLGNRPA